jgi:hypothetical protein
MLKSIDALSISQQISFSLLCSLDVRVSVFVTTMSDNPFSQQPYDEEKIITVPNVYKFLGFHEDVRPPYHGTWSKTR